MAIPSGEPSGVNPETGLFFIPERIDSPESFDQIELKTIDHYVGDRPHAAQEFFSTCVSMAFHQSERIETQKFLQHEAKSKLLDQKSSPHAERAVDSILSGVNLAVAQARFVKQLAADELHGSKEELLTNPDARFDLIELLACKEVEPNNIFGDPQEMMANLWVIDGADGDTVSIVLKLRSELQSGHYDGQILKSFLQDVDRQPVESLDESEQQVKELIVFARALGGHDNTEDAIAQMIEPENLPSVPNILHFAIDRIRCGLARDITTKSHHRLRNLEKYFLVIPPTSKNMFERRRRDLAVKLRAQESQGVRTLTKAEQAAQRVQSRNDRRKTQSRSMGSIARKRSTPEREFPQRRLYTHIGERFMDETSPEFMDAITEKIKKTCEGDPDLIPALQVMLDKLRNIDEEMSKGIVSGLTKLKGSNDLYRLKPNEACGTSAKSENKSKLRIIFSFRSDSSIQIQEIQLRRNLWGG